MLAPRQTQIEKELRQSLVFNHLLISSIGSGAPSITALISFLIDLLDSFETFAQVFLFGFAFLMLGALLLLFDFFLIWILALILLNFFSFKINFPILLGTLERRLEIEIKNK